MFDDLVNLIKKIAMKEAVDRQIAPRLSDLQIEGLSTNVSSSITNELKQLAVGQWILFHSQGQRLRVKLAMINQEADSYFFVNLLGAKKFTKSALF